MDSGALVVEVVAAVRRALHRGRGQEGHQVSAHAHRAGARAAAAVGRGEGLVQVEVHHVDARVAGAELAHHGVEVGAVHVDQRRPRRARSRRSRRCAVSNSPRVLGLVTMIAGDLVVQVALARASGVQRAALVRGRELHRGEAVERAARPGWCRGRCRGSGPCVRRCPRGRGGRRGSSSGRTARPGRPAAGCSVTRAKPPIAASICSSSYISSRAPWSISLGLVGVQLAKDRQPRGGLGALGVVLHGAGAQRVHAAVDAEVPLRRRGEVAHHLGLADLGQPRRALRAAAQRARCAAGSTRARRSAGREAPRRPGTLWVKIGASAMKQASGLGVLTRFSSAAQR